MHGIPCCGRPTGNDDRHASIGGSTGRPGGNDNDHDHNHDSLVAEAPTAQEGQGPEARDGVDVDVDVDATRRRRSSSEELFPGFVEGGGVEGERGSTVSGGGQRRESADPLACTISVRDDGYSEPEGKHPGLMLKAL